MKTKFRILEWLAILNKDFDIVLRAARHADAGDYEMAKLVINEIDNTL